MINGIGGLHLQMVLKLDTFLIQIETVRIISTNGFHLRKVMEVTNFTLFLMVEVVVVLYYNNHLPYNHSLDKVPLEEEIFFQHI